MFLIIVNTMVTKKNAGGSRGGGKAAGSGGAAGPGGRSRSAATGARRERKGTATSSAKGTKKKTGPPGRKTSGSGRKTKAQKTGKPARTGQAKAVGGAAASGAGSGKRKTSRPAAKRPSGKKTGVRTASGSPQRRSRVVAVPAAMQKRILDILVQKRAILAGDASRIESGTILSDKTKVAANHLADFGTESFEQEFNLSLLQSRELTLLEIDAAIRRIREGSFGICEDCGCIIPVARLEAIPYTRLCVACQARRESES